MRFTPQALRQLGRRLALTAGLGLVLACTEEEVPAEKKKKEAKVEEKDPEDEPADEPEPAAKPTDDEPEETETSSEDGGLEESSGEVTPPSGPAGPAPAVTPKKDGALEDAKKAEYKTSFEGCANNKTAWVAVTGSNGPPSCGTTLVSWCCKRENVAKRFPGTAAALETRFKAFIDDAGMKLYHCSTDADGKTRFHFVRFDAQVVYRSTITKETMAAGVTDEADCNQASFDSLF